MSTASTVWNTYWDELPEGYLFFPQEGEEAVRLLNSAVGLTNTHTVLDYGCGYGHAAMPLAKRVGQLWIWDYSEPMRRFATQYLSVMPNVKLWQPNSNEVLFDVIWINSVVQYMTAASFLEVLQQLATRIKPTGKIVVSDLIPPTLPFYSDVLSLLRFSLRKGYFLKAFRRAFALRKRYSTLAESSPLYHPTREEVLNLAAKAGLVGEYLPTNLTHFRGREAVILRQSLSSGV
jgi:trans-aconitate methyltransferase